MRISDWSSDMCSSDLNPLRSMAGRGGRETSARLVRRRLLGNQLRRPGERPGRRMAKDRTMTYRASGKQVLKAGEYFADASTNEAARVIVAALNLPAVLDDRARRADRKSAVWGKGV